MEARTIPATRLGLRRRNGSVATQPQQKSAIDGVGARFEEELADRDATVLHDLSVDGERIDHLIVGRAGITVIDASHYGDKRVRVGHGGLRVGRKNRSDIVHDVLDQAAAVSDFLADTRYADVHVEAALAWREVEGLPILHSFNAPRVIVCGTTKIAREASRQGPLSARRVASLATLLEAELGA